MHKVKEQLIFNVLYKWKYLIAMFISNFDITRSGEINKLIYVARENDIDWIFGAKVRRLSRYSSLNASAYFHNKLKNLPEADGYYFIHQNYFCKAILKNPSVLSCKNIVMFTHPNWTTKFSKTHIVWCLNKADFIICLNSQMKEELTRLGVEQEKLIVLHIASDPELFYPHERSNGLAGFCSNFGERKNPELIFQIIKNMPQKQFMLIGKNWQKFDKFEELIQFDNFTYHDNVDYSNYPDLYNQIDTFISPSVLEGGPVPVLEAMLSNCVPVATKTGFCPDLIDHGVNGFLFDADANYKEVIALIEQADSIKSNVRESVMNNSWENCSRSIDSLFLRS